MAPSMSVFPIPSAITPANKSGVWEIDNRRDTAGIALNEEEHPKRTTLRASQLAVASRSSRIVHRCAHAVHPARRGRDGPHPGHFSLAKKYGATATEETRAAALEMGLQEHLGWVDDGRRRT